MHAPFRKRKEGKGLGREMKLEKTRKWDSALSVVLYFFTKKKKAVKKNVNNFLDLVFKLVNIFLCSVPFCMF